MHKRICWILASAALLLCLIIGAQAEAAKDITQTCLYNGANGYSIKDDSYGTIWESSWKNGIHSLTIEAPEGQTIGGVLIRWHSWPLALNMQVCSENGDWETIGGCDADFLAQYIPVESYRTIRLLERETDGRVKLEISSITVFSPGEVPYDVQMWQKPAEKVDLMLLSGHPDDEVLWFGGLLPFYAGEQNKNVLVVNASYAREDRRLELLDCLWACGVRIHPVFLAYPDVCTFQKTNVMQRCEWQHARDDVAVLYRRYKPDVVVLHDEKGEYGHGVHQVIAEAGREAAQLAQDAGYDPQSGEAYGLWEIPKIYMHLQQENQVQMNWHVPLETFGGLTAYEAAEQAFLCHKSQLGKWKMQIGGEYDNSLFGLWRSTVGADLMKEDLFENIVP